MNYLEEHFANKINSLTDYAVKNLAVALSGGVDSMCLLMLAKKWAENNGAKLTALIVDHKLRDNSTIEANQVKDYCLNNAIACEILTWHHDDITSAIQEQARDARYKLLTSWCVNNSYTHLLTGHQLNDQIEQLLISLSQGASIYGLLISEKCEVNEVNVIRPLLEVSKDKCTEYLKLYDVNWWEDSTNVEPKYLRNRIRPLVNTYIDLIKDDIQRVNTSLHNIKRASISLSHITEAFLTTNAKISNLGYASMQLECLISQTEEVRLSALSALIKLIGKHNSYLRLKSLKLIEQEILKKRAVENTFKQFTLGGCLIYFTKDNVYFIREFGKNCPNNSLMVKGEFWDERFLINVNIDGYYSSYLSEKDYIKHKKNITPLLIFAKELPHSVKLKILYSLPVVITLEKLVAIPHIYYNDSTYTLNEEPFTFIRKNKF